MTNVLNSVNGLIDPLISVLSDVLGTDTNIFNLMNCGMYFS